MSTARPEPKKLRTELVRKVESMSDEDLVFLHRILLQVEKERLWKELSSEVEEDWQTGRYDNLDELIRQVRTELAASRGP